MFYDHTTAHTDNQQRAGCRRPIRRTSARRGVAIGIAAGCLLAICLIAGVDASFAQGSVRAWGMGGAYLSAARGLEATAWNPANLAFSPGVSVGFASAALDISNNAFSLGRYNEVTGATLNQADKDRLLADIPDSGFKLEADVRASAFGVHVGRFAMSFQGLAAASGTLDRDVFELVLNGNQLDETVAFEKTNGEGYAIGSAALSTGQPVAQTRLGRLSVGGSLRYYQGFYELHVENASGSITTTMDEIAGDAELALVTASGGTGYGVDLGAALEAPLGWTFGLTLDNVLSSMSWNGSPERMEFSLSAVDINLVNEDFDAAVADADTTYAIDAYSTSLPRSLRLGASNTFGKLLVAADYVQGLEGRYGVSTTPQFNAGLEWRPVGAVRPRFGLSAGGRVGQSIAGGLGMKFGPWRMDFAVVNRGGYLPYDLRGLGFAFGSLLEF